MSAFQKHLSLSSCAPLAQYFSANGHLVCDYLKLHQISLLPVFTPLVVSVTMQLASCISVNILLLGLSTCWCCLLYVVNIGIKCMFQCKSVAGGWLRKEGIVRHPYAFILEGGATNPKISMKRQLHRASTSRSWLGHHQSFVHYWST